MSLLTLLHVLCRLIQDDEDLEGTAEILDTVHEEDCAED